MRHLVLSFITVLTCISGNAQQWHPAGDRLKTQWTEQVDPANPLPEYPRPILERDEWQNLNGLWDYAILPKGHSLPDAFDGKILVPFAVESSLSGVQKPVGAENELWYARSFSIPASWKGKHILLNFGAIDWKCDIWINSIRIGSHQGGYIPFTFDITAYLSKETQQTLMVRVWDPTNAGYQPRGKKRNRGYIGRGRSWILCAPTAKTRRKMHLCKEENLFIDEWERFRTCKGFQFNIYIQFFPIKL